MENILESAFSTAEIKSLSGCRGMLQCIFLSDLVTDDGRYLESFVFNPGPIKRRSNYCFPRERPTKRDWDTWFNFWHNYATTGGKLKVPIWTHHHTGNGYGTPPQLTTFTELRTELSTTIYQHSPNVARAQFWRTHSHGKSRSE